MVSFTALRQEKGTKPSTKLRFALLLLLASALAMMFQEASQLTFIASPEDVRRQISFDLQSISSPLSMRELPLRLEEDPILSLSYNRNSNNLPETQKQDYDETQHTKTRYQPISCDDLQRYNKTQDIHVRNNYSNHKKLTVTNPSFWISIHDKNVDFVRWPIMKNGYYYETGVTDMFEQILNHHSSSPSALVLDVGMNIGWFSLWSAALGHPVYAFEPNIINWFRQCESLELNGWNGQHPRVSIFPYGAGDEQDTLLELTWGDNPGGASFDSIRKTNFSTTALSIRLDDFAIDQGWITASGSRRSSSSVQAIGLLKVDVEGFEPQVLLGAKKLIQSGMVENVLMEFVTRRYKKEKDKAEQVIELLIQSGYMLQAVGNTKGIVNPKMLEHMLDGTNDGSNIRRVIRNLWNWKTKFPDEHSTLNLWWRLT